MTDTPTTPAAAAAEPPLATVWGIRDGMVLCCFRAAVDAEGRIRRTLLGEREDRYEVEDRDQEVTARLRLRYGAELELRIIPDGGAGFADFQQALADRVRPIVSPPSPSPARAPRARRAGQPSLFP
jgi:hypothetical protein